MNHLRLALFFASTIATAYPARAETLALKAADGVTVYADFEGGKAGARPILILFHQAGSNRHEYDPVAPRLNDMGFDTLAVDQRAGGHLFGHDNETAAALGRAPGYLAAYPDMEAALAWAEGTGAKTILIMGSSYSSALVFELAADHPKSVDAVLSFSPGEYFSPGDRVRKAAARLKVPVFVSQASDPSEVATAKPIVDAVPQNLVTHFKPKSAPHGASALREDANGKGAAEVWRAVAAFLKPFA